MKTVWLSGSYVILSASSFGASGTVRNIPHVVLYACIFSTSALQRVTRILRDGDESGARSKQVMSSSAARRLTLLIKTSHFSRNFPSPFLLLPHFSVPSHPPVLYHPRPFLPTPSSHTPAIRPSASFLCLMTNFSAQVIIDITPVKPSSVFHILGDY